MIEFGTGLDTARGTVTGPTTTFTIGASIAFVAHLSAAPGSDVRITIVRDMGVTQRVAASSVLATPSPTGRTLFNTLNTAFISFQPGSYILEIFHLDHELAHGDFSLTHVISTADFANQSGSDAVIEGAVEGFRQALHEVYGPAYSVSTLGEVAVGRASQAVLCTVEGSPNSLVNSHSYITYGDPTEQFEATQVNGNTATAKVHIQQRIDTHHADGTVSGFDADYTDTFSLVNTGFTWKVSDYNWVGSDGSTGGAAQDAQPCGA